MSAEGQEVDAEVIIRPGETMYEAVARTVGLPVDDPRVIRMVENQLEPQVFARELRADGQDVQTVRMVPDADAEGIVLTCGGCGRTAVLRADMRPPRPNQVAMCPDCMRGKARAKRN